jgi:TM2 domain-containing membrane protein YozV
MIDVDITCHGGKLFMDPIICPNCGASSDPAAKFCANCGNPQTPQAQQTYTPPYSGSYQQQPVNYALKSKIAAGLFGIFLGVFGVHNFYLGYTNKAIAQLLITLLSCGVLAVVSSIWGLIEGILILTNSITVDGYGQPLRD